MAKQYIFKLTPNNNTVVINTSVLINGSYPEVTYPLKTLILNSNIMVDKDTFKYITSDDYKFIDSAYPIGLDINGYIKDIPFYAKNKELGYIDIGFSDLSINVDELNRLYRLSSNNGINSNITITPIWNTDSSISLNTSDISINIKIKKYEHITQDSSGILESNFDDFNKFIEFYNNKCINTLLESAINNNPTPEILNILDLRIDVNKIDKLFNVHITNGIDGDVVDPNDVTINVLNLIEMFGFKASELLDAGLINIDSIKDIIQKDIIDYSELIDITYKYTDTSILTDTDIFRDSLYTEKRQVGELILTASYKDPSSNIETPLVTKTFPIYLVAYQGPCLKYYPVKLCDYTNPIELWSPTVTFNTGNWLEDANPKVSDDTQDIWDSITINGTFDPSSYITNDKSLHVDTYITNVDVYNSSTLNKELYFDNEYIIDYYYFDTSTYNTQNSDYSYFENAVLKCINIVKDSSEKRNYLYLNNFETFDTSTFNILINDNSTKVTCTNVTYNAAYTKYVVIDKKYYLILDISGKVVTYAEDNSKDYDYRYYNTSYNTSYNTLDTSKNTLDISNATIVNYKLFENPNNGGITLYMYCINNPFTDSSVQVPVYAAYPILYGYIPKLQYEYDFTNKNTIQILSSSEYKLCYDPSILTRDHNTNGLILNIDDIDIDKLYIDENFENNMTPPKPLADKMEKNQYRSNGKLLNTVNNMIYGAGTESVIINEDNQNNQNKTYTLACNIDTSLLSFITINSSLNLMASNGNTSNNITENKISISPYIFTIALDSSILLTNGYTTDISIFLNNSTDTNIKGKLLITNDEGEKHFHKFKYEGKDINNNLESFMLLRANPKLSGNIKLVIDSEYNLYLDTFKSSDLLNNSQYRKYPISAEGNYPRDIKQVFKSLPISELYKTSKNSLNAHKIYTDYQDQYETMYEFGAETNTDVLYSENMKILAPLHIGKNIPEFFAIFKYDGVYNTETYNNTGFVDIDKFKSLISDSKIIKTIDLRQYTSIGQYLNNYKNMIQNYGYGQCGLLFIEQDNYFNSDSYRQGKNIWKGILVKQGILAEQSETSYFANKILNDSSLKNKQELFNSYIQSGFERHGLVYPNIINLEFMFDDPENEEYTMHRYFGLYLYENDFIDYGFITDTKKGNTNVLLKYDISGNIYTNDLNTLRNIFNKNYNDRIFFAITNDYATRISNETDVNDFLSDYIKNTPEYNIAESPADKLIFDEKQQSFITLHIKKPLQYGEHIKIILMGVRNKDYAYTSNNTSTNNILFNHLVYEIIASNDERLRTSENYINPYVTTHICEYNNSVIYKLISFYSQDILYPEASATIADLITRIIACINKFNTDDITVSYKDKTSVSLISNHYNTYLQHIAAPDLDSFKYDYMHINGINDSKIHICTTNHKCQDSLKYITDDISTNIGDYNRYIDNTYNVIYESDPDDSANPYKYYSYVESEDINNIKEDNISYYNKEISYNMKAISPITEYYDSYYIPFSMYMFESLGWRHNTVVLFINISSIRNVYVLYNDITDKIKNVNTPLVYNTNNLYETVHKFNINSGYLLNNIINPLDYGAFFINNQLFIFDENVNNSIVISNPFNSNYNILCSDSDILLTNNMIRLYKPKSALIAVMGISNIKDIDTNVELNTEIHREQRLYARFTENEIVKTDESDIRLLHGVLYEVIEGTLSLLDGSTKICSVTLGVKFIIDSNNNVYLINNYNSILNNVVSTDAIFANTNTIIKLIDKQKYQEYNYTTLLPEIKLEHFFNDITDIYNSDLMYPIVPTVNCAWKSTGLYIDDNNVIDTNNMSKDYILEYGHFTESVFTPDIFEPNQYVINKINNILFVDGEPTTFKDCILNKSLTHPIKKLLIDNVNINTAICHYNPNTYSLEFIYFGIKFVIKFNDKIVNTYLHLDSYDNYNVFVLNEYDSSKTNELYISDHEEFILLVNHKFYIDYAHEADNNIKDLELGIGYAPYSTYKAPINIDFSTISVDNKKLLSGYMNYNSDNILNHIDINNLWSSWYIQGGIDNYIYSPLESIMTYDNYISFVNYTGKDEFYSSVNINNNSNTLYAYIMTKADGDYNTNYIKVKIDNGSTFDFNVLNIIKLSKFDILSELNNDTSILSSDSTNALLEYANRILYRETVRDKQQRYIQSVNDNIDIYIIPETSDYKYIQNTSEYNPLMFNLSIPNYIKYNYGYFTPNTNNMVEYSIDDLELGTLIDVDLLCANTNVTGIYKLLNYTGNKVFETSDKKVLLNYFTVPERSLLSSTWDNGYYRLYQAESSFIPYDGQLTGIDDKSFFGSRCMILRNQYILLDKWSYETGNDLYFTSIVDSEFNESSENSKCLLIDIKLSNVLYHFFINNKNFTDNWHDFKEALYTGMKNYINYTMTSFYNMNSHVDLLIFKIDTNPNESINIIESDEYNPYYQLYENYKSKINFVNNEYILTIIIDDTVGMNIHPVLKIYRK